MDNHYNIQEDRVNKFWHRVFKTATEEKIFLKDLSLPLARIKRLMKVEEGVRMVASEVPVLFSIITEKFIEELTLRAWVNTEENKRRILQKSDLTAAVKTSEMYDFLVHIIPRHDLGHPFNQVLVGRPSSSEKVFLYPRAEMHPGPRHMEDDRRQQLKSMENSVPSNYFIQSGIQTPLHVHPEMPVHSEMHIPQGIHMEMDYDRNYPNEFSNELDLNLPADNAPDPFI